MQAGDKVAYRYNQALTGRIVEVNEITVYNKPKTVFEVEWLNLTGLGQPITWHDEGNTGKNGYGEEELVLTSE